MFTKHIKIAQLLLYCVIVQSYIAVENRLKEDTTFLQDRCSDKIYDNKNGGNGSFEYHLLSYIWLSYKWSSTKSYNSNIRGRTFSEHSLEDQPSVPVEKSDNKVKDRKITANELIKRTKLIVTDMKKFKKNAKNANFSQNFKEANFDADLLLTFVMMIYQWTSDVAILSTIGNAYYEEIFKLPERCTLQTNYTLQDRIVRSSDIISTIKVIQNQLHKMKSKELEKKSYNTIERNLRTAELLIKLIKSIVFELNYLNVLEKLNSKETVLSLHLNKDIIKLQLFAYKWVLNIRYPNIHKKSIKNKNSQPPLKDQSSLPMDKHDNEPTSYRDQEKNAADVLKRESRSLTTEGKTIDASTKLVCEFKETIHHSLEMDLYVFGVLSFDWFSSQDYTVGGRSLNDFQLTLEDQFFSLPVEESDSEDDEITIKDFMDSVKLTKRRIENLKISEETTMDTDNESSQKLQNVKGHIHVKRSNVDSNKKYLNFLRVKYELTIYRWISNIIIYNTISKMSLGDIFPHLRECQPMFPVKKTNEQLKEFEEISDEIIDLIQLLQTTASKI
ncbi:PREDICTED: uncharacterized protein LOC108755331 [Trachymyrmex septentrionalis]|uniref:uncharacterized protein LOC108755331 n=1 Tax=Trachymyrmex septentrionalis TaxID=34720 RepID=UPI00084ED38F|nr:PREDICTED: uncharacterized protein LOC108755331 [Trachymyrmex septentrionalis]